MKHIKEYKSFDEPVFDFSQTAPIVSRREISEKWTCSDCDHSWKIFNKQSPTNCKNCGSGNIIPVENTEPDDQYVSIYDLGNRKYESNEEETDVIVSVSDEIKSMIESTIENSGGEFNSFIDSYKKDPNSVKIEGLINDSDIYDFYLKYRNDIDEILSEVKFYDEIPSEINTFGLYDYIITGTTRAVSEFINKF